MIGSLIMSLYIILWKYIIGLFIVVWFVVEEKGEII